MIHFLFGLTLVSALGSGLIAGLFFAFSSFVMTALSRLSPDNGIKAMQSINVTVLNPSFGIVFFGTTLTSLALGITALIYWGEVGSGWMLIGSLCYFIGSFLVTAMFNVPWNNRLEAVQAEHSESAELWRAYVAKWTRWNHVRCAASLAALAAYIMVLLAIAS